jgi:uncharacterized membrane protein YdfJ with MMPL/SSD domain
MERWTRTVLRFRKPIVAGWILVLLAGGFGLTKLSKLQSNTFTVPGTDSERVRVILQDHFGDRSDGSFTVVFRVPSGTAERLLERLQQDTDRAARAVPTAHATPLLIGSPTVVYGDVTTTMNLAQA